jgi:hypothetical protein
MITPRKPTDSEFEAMVKFFVDGSTDSLEWPRMRTKLDKCTIGVHSTTHGTFATVFWVDEPIVTILRIGVDFVVTQFCEYYA